MDCETAIERFLALDNGEEMPAELENHLAACSECRRRVDVMQSVFTALQLEGRAEPAAGSTEEVMQSVRAAAGGAGVEEPLSVAKWLATGVIIFASIVLVSFSKSHMWLSRVFGTSLELPLSLILGAIIAIYATLFIGTHVDKVAGFFGLRRR